MTTRLLRETGAGSPERNPGADQQADAAPRLSERLCGDPDATPARPGATPAHGRSPVMAALWRARKAWAASQPQYSLDLDV